MAGLTRPEAAKAAAKVYALQVADTVVVQPGGEPPEVVTALVPKGWTDAAYFFNVRSLRISIEQRSSYLGTVHCVSVTIADH